MEKLIEYVANEAVCFDDILLVPQEGHVRSRKDVGLGMRLGTESRPESAIVLDVPIIAAPMDTVCEKELALAISDAGGLGIVHRYMSHEDTIYQASWLFNRGCERFGVAVSTSDCSDEDYIGRLMDEGVRVICIDTANGHSSITKSAVRRLRRIVGDFVHIMAGNVSTYYGYSGLIDAGADSVRVGIGGGSACTTRVVSGHGAPTLWSLMDSARGDRGGLIADGGIRNTGDMVKSFAAGASAVMVGRLLAGCDESPSIKNNDGQIVYRGMASGSAQRDWRGSYDSEEGVVGVVEARGPVRDVMNSFRFGIASGCSYSGVDRLSDLWYNSEYIRVSTLSNQESNHRL